MQPKAPTRVPTADVGFLDLPESVLVIVRAAGITSESDFAWSWNEEELRKELEEGGVVLGEIDRAVRQLTSARASSVEAMGAVCTSPLPRAVSATGQPCAPVVGKAAKVRKVHLHGVAAPSTGQLCAPVVVRAAPSSGQLCAPEEKQDIKHTIAFETVSGAHFNPAATVASMRVGSGKRPPKEDAMYMMVQILGGELCAASIYSAMKGPKTFQLKPVAHGWANVIVAELIFTLMPVFVVPFVVTVSSSLSQFSGFAIGMCVAIGGCVIGKISEGSLNPEAYSSGSISMGCFNPAGAEV